MDDATLQTILSRFDKLDTKIDGFAIQHADLRVDVETVKGDVAGLQSESMSGKIRDYIGYGVSLLMAAVFGIQMHGK
jgi:hypothetical protein